jgi:hypothetical protein
MIVGRPQNVEGFQPLSPEEFAYLRQPIDQAISQGIPFEQPVQVDFTVLCRLIKTVIVVSSELKRIHEANPSVIASLSDANTVEEPSVPPLPSLNTANRVSIEE